MIAVIPFAPEHLSAIVPQAAQSHGVAGAPGEGGPAFTAIGAGGRVLLCAGFHVNNPHYATAWALLAEAKGPAMVALTRATRRVIAATSYARVDMLVRTDWPEAHAWARLLGFTREGTMRRAGAAGEDVDLYACIKGNI